MRDDLLNEVIGALPGWLVRAQQFNDLVAARLGVSSSDLQALFVLSTEGSLTPGELGRQIGLTTGAASRMVERLVVAELVTRSPDAADRRRVIVTARPEALDEVARHYGPLNEQLRQALGGFDDAGLRALRDFARAAEATTEGLLRAEAPDTPTRTS
ncbi:MarR family winged helix-turn-helix transcriptional regulator [Jiangella alba]|uniref:DNA-binding transcriptional regulator, MarR family n=1 Tax=Jiangella alba TaxID=561176 RepID=A0A1H5I5S0_9ACTN|nr:MarR family transcriptional regulator [Jiangella alba]SEE35404.1 DNA-binding transcriptional regulator, MarR family [Jiangella alba]